MHRRQTHDLRAAASFSKKTGCNPESNFGCLFKKDFHEARKEGVMKILEDAGAKILPTSCGLCAVMALNVWDKEPFALLHGP